MNETLYRDQLESLAHLHRLSETGLEQVRMAFANFLVDHENHGAAHFKAAKFIATVKRVLLIRNPVQAPFVARELTCVRQDGIVIHNANAADVCRTDLDHEHFGTVRQAEFTRQAFIDAEKTFDAFNTAWVDRPKRTRAIGLSILLIAFQIILIWNSKTVILLTIAYIYILLDR